MIEFVECYPQFKQIASHIAAYTQIDAEYREIFVNYVVAVKTKIELMTKPLDERSRTSLTLILHQL